MIYPFITLDDQTEIVHSELLDNNEIKVYMERRMRKIVSIMQPAISLAIVLKISLDFPKQIWSDCYKS